MHNMRHKCYDQSTLYKLISHRLGVIQVKLRGYTG